MTRKTAIQRDAAEFLRATRRLLKLFRDSPPKVDEAYDYASTMRTFARILKGIGEAKTDPELAAEMRLSLDLLRHLEDVRLSAGTSDDAEADEVLGCLERTEDLAQLIYELEAIRKRKRE
jgi:hypothetical protein